MARAWRQTFGFPPDQVVGRRVNSLQADLPRVGRGSPLAGPLYDWVGWKAAILMVRWVGERRSYRIGCTTDFLMPTTSNKIGSDAHGAKLRAFFA